MSITSGALSQVSIAANSSNLLVGAASGGTGPYTYQMYRSTVDGFTPGVGNLIAGATALTLIDTGLTPNTTYYYRNITTDAVNATDTSNQLTVVTTASAAQDSNQFEPSPIVGQLDQRYSNNSQACVVDASELGKVYPGAAVKQVASTSGVAHVVLCDASTDNVYGFANYNAKNPYYVAGNAIEISKPGNCMFLMPTVTGTLPAQAQLDVTTPGGVAPVVGSSGAEVVGDFLDKPVAGTPARVTLGYQLHTKA